MKISKLDKELRIDAIKKAAEKGLTMAEIAKEVGLSCTSVFRYNRTYRLFPSGKRGRKILTNPEAFRQALSNGVNSLEELCKMGGFRTLSGIKRHCERNNITLPENITPYKTRPEIDCLIEQGLTLGEIGKETGLSGERIRQYINESSQYNEWKQNKIKKRENRASYEKQKQESYSSLISLLKARAFELAKEEGWHAQKALECENTYKHKKDRIPFSSLYSLFKKYKDAKKKGKKLTLEDFGDELGTSRNSIGRIFTKTGVEPMYGKKERKIKPGEKMEHVIRGIKTPFSGRDIAYFLNLPEYIPKDRLSQRGINVKERSPYILGGERLSYRLASQIYEAKDCSFDVGETAYLLNKNEDIVDFALFLRKEIEQKIVKGLRILYNDKTIKKPYVTKRCAKN